MAICAKSANALCNEYPQIMCRKYVGALRNSDKGGSTGQGAGCQAYSSTMAPCGVCAWCFAIWLEKLCNTLLSETELLALPRLDIILLNAVCRLLMALDCDEAVLSDDVEDAPDALNC